jgi:hypothetical protein
MRMQSETMDHKIARQTLDKRVRLLVYELDDLKARLKELSGSKVAT